MRPTRVLALGRHAATEVLGARASPGAQLFFSSLEEGLRRHYRLLRVPSYYYAMDARRALGIASDVLHAVDACVFGLTPHAVDLDAFFLMRARLQKRVPFVYIPLGELPRGAWWYRHICSRLEAQDLVFFSSRADRAIHDALVSSTPARTVVVPWGIRAPRFRVSRHARSETRRQLGVTPDEVVFAYHGRVDVEKNVHGALMMFRRVARDHPAARMWVIGPLPGHKPLPPGPLPLSALHPHPLTRVFATLLQGEGLAERVDFWGAVSPAALPQLLGAADLAINLTLNEDENFGYSTVEAMAAGLPVIGSDWGGLKDTIDDGVTGFRVPTQVTPHGVALDQWRAWRHAVDLVENADRRREMGVSARRRAIECFDQMGFAAAVAREIDIQLDDTARASLGPHAWTPLGKRLEARYSKPHPADPARRIALPIAPTPTRHRDHPLLRALLQRYATERRPSFPFARAVFFLATDLIELNARSARSTDPIYVTGDIPLDPAARAVVQMLKKRGFCSSLDLLRELTPRFRESAIRAALKRLMKHGIVRQSDRSGI